MTIAMPDTLVDNELFTDLINSLDKPWQILVLDDSVNSTDYVTAVFMKHFKLEHDVALLRMLEVHQDGRSTLDCGEKDKMIAHKKAMNDYGLQAVIEQPS